MRKVIRRAHGKDQKPWDESECRGKNGRKEEVEKGARLEVGKGLVRCQCEDCVEESDSGKDGEARYPGAQESACTVSMNPTGLNVPTNASRPRKIPATARAASVSGGEASLFLFSAAQMASTAQQ